MASVTKNPNYAVICSFLERYGELLKLPYFTFPELKEAIEDQKTVFQPLRELHVKLMRKLNKSCSYDKWEKSLLKFTWNVSNVAYWELQKLGYAEMEADVKVDILKFLCEAQFDENIKFKTFINKEIEADTMRVQPVGRDRNGLVYWYQQDLDFNIGIYREEQDDIDGSTWHSVVSDREELSRLIVSLRGVTEKKSDDTDSTSGSVTTNDQKNADDENSRDSLDDKTPVSIDKIKKESQEDEDDQEQKEERKDPKSASTKDAEQKESAVNSESIKKEETADEEDEKEQKDSKEGDADKTQKVGDKEEEQTDKEKDKKEDDQKEEEDKPSDDEEKENGTEDKEEEMIENEEEVATKEPKKRGRKKKRRGRPRLTLKKTPRKAVAKKPSYKEISDEEKEDDEEDDEEEEEEKCDDDKPCCKCGQYDQPEWILLCDKCDAGYHTACLRPPLMMIPDGEWFCPSCEHVTLIVKLQEMLELLDGQIKRKERRQRKKERQTFIGINPANIIQMENERITKIRTKKGKENIIEDIIFERRSGRQRKQISYRFEEFDDAINSAIRDEVKEKQEYQAECETAGAGVSRGKDISTIVEESEKELSQTSHWSKRARKKRLMDLDATSEESYSSEEVKYGSSSSDSEGDFIAENDEDISESDSSHRRPKQRRRGRRGKPYIKPTRRSQRNSRNLQRYYSDSMDDEDEEDDFESDESSDYSDEFRRKRALRKIAQKRRVSYREQSDSGNSATESSADEKPQQTLPQELRKSRVVKHRLVTDSEEESTEKSSEDEKSDDEQGESMDHKDSDFSVNEIAKRKKRYEDDSDFEAEVARKKLKERHSQRSEGKRVNYQALLGQSSEEEDEEQKEDDDIESDDESVTKDHKIVETHVKPLSATEKNGTVKYKTTDKVRIVNSETSVDKIENQDKEATSAATVSAPSVAASSAEVSHANGQNFFNGVKPEPEESDDEDELLNVTDLVDYVTRDTL